MSVSTSRDNNYNSTGGAVSASAIMASTAAAPSATITTTLVTSDDSTNNTTTTAPQVLRLTLRNHPGVRWDATVVDNEGMGRKSSKRCCIFHKQRAFDESSTDSSDQDADHHDDHHDKTNQNNNENGGSNRKRIARPKKKPEVPDFQRFHA
ncbi:hypothetical protein ACA910_012054 [Epithemia clementina (nom. ined.)]